MVLLQPTWSSMFDSHSDDASLRATVTPTRRSSDSTFVRLDICCPILVNHFHQNLITMFRDKFKDLFQQKWHVKSPRSRHPCGRRLRLEVVTQEFSKPMTGGFTEQRHLEAVSKLEHLPKLLAVRGAPHETQIV